jgi:hypothetical protein
LISERYNQIKIYIILLFHDNYHSNLNFQIPDSVVPVVSLFTFPESCSFSEVPVLVNWNSLHEIT